MATHKLHALGHESAAHEATEMIVETAKSTYVLVILAALGVLAFITAVLVAWPAVAYLAAKLF